MYTTCEDLILLSFSGGTQAVPVRPTMVPALAGTALTDLLLAERIVVSGDGVNLVDWSPLGIGYLDTVLGRIHAAGEARPVEYWLDDLSDGAIDLEAAVLDAMNERSLLTADAWPLAGGLTVTGFATGPKAAARIKRLLDHLEGKKPIKPREALLIGLAHACRLFERVLGGKELRRLAERIDHAARLPLAGSEIVAAVTASYVDAEAASSAAPAGGRRLWEWRAFWSEQVPTLAATGALASPPGRKLSTTRVTDRYLLIPERRDSVKVRADGLEVKQCIETYGQLQAFMRKQKFKFPFVAADIAALFPRLSGLDEPIEDINGLEALLNRLDYAPRLLKARKRRFRINFDASLRYEFAEVTVRDQVHWTVCVEGPDHGRILAERPRALPERGKVMGYVDFLASVTVT